MRLPWHRDLIRHCLHCGEEWRVPHGLAKRYRPSKWRVGVAPADYRAMGGALFDASIHDQLDAAKQRAETAEGQVAHTDLLRQCPKCGSSAYTEHKAPSTPPPG